MSERNVVITGAASGIGRATAAGLGAAGWRVISIDQRDADIVADLSKPDERARAIAEATAAAADSAVTDSAAADSGDIDAPSLAGIVTCAGLAGTPDRKGSLLSSVNFFGTVEILEGLRPLLGPGGAAVAISSNSTTVQPAIPADLVEACLARDEAASARLADEHGALATYPASKLAVALYVRQQAVGPDWAGSGLRLNAVAPGMIDTPMIAGVRADPEAGPMLDLLPIPVGRPGRPEEIAALIGFLLGPDASFFCGSVVFCDGGSDALLRARDWPAAWDISVGDFVHKS